MSRQFAEMMEMHRKQQLVVKTRCQDLQPVLSARRRQMTISNAIPLHRIRLAQQHVFVFRRNLSK
jgi:hypothetical protein